MSQPPSTIQCDGVQFSFPWTGVSGCFDKSTVCTLVGAGLVLVGQNSNAIPEMSKEIFRRFFNGEAVAKAAEKMAEIASSIPDSIPANVV
mmetsp:Transcript_14770/g.40396  ORF Transcript_14770/g.40396 Transcript_14770/m.40396 type:complete len:90 (+) Transcript_14770:160-429(+)